MQRTAKQSAKAIQSDELLGFMTAIISEFLVDRAELEEFKANQLSLDLVDELRLKFGGCLVYFKKGSHYDADDEAQSILEDFENGQSVTQLVMTYQKSVATIYKLIKKARNNRRLERQEAESSVRGLG